MSNTTIQKNDANPLETLMGSVHSETPDADAAAAVPAPQASEPTPESNTPAISEATETPNTNAPSPTPEAYLQKLEDESKARKEAEASNSDLPQVEEQKSDGTISDWDAPVVSQSPEQQNEQPTDTSDSIQSIAIRLGLGPDASSEAIVSHVEQLRSSPNDEGSVFSNEALKQANEIAKSGGDWRGYLSTESANYKQIADKDLVIQELQNVMGKSEDFDAEDYVDGMSDAEIRIKGAEIRQRLERQDEVKRQEIIQETTQRKAMIDTGIKDALSRVDDVAGFRVSDNHKSEIFDGLTSGKLIRDMFYTDNGQPDYGKMVDSAFKALYFDKVVGYLKTASANDGKRQVLKNLQNVDLSQPKHQGEHNPPPAEQEASIELLSGLMDGTFKFH
jgi:hypothetical protein